MSKRHVATDCSSSIMKKTKDTRASFIKIYFSIVASLLWGLQLITAQSRAELPRQSQWAEKWLPGKKLSDMTLSGKIIIYSGNARQAIRVPPERRTAERSSGGLEGFPFGGTQLHFHMVGTTLTNYRLQKIQHRSLSLTLHIQYV